ncbi:hypothetical protein BKA62DRAFT_683137 [Auriculariales sp. MPI-PUGE-AT-0066]|nr:hypothetical protein BKA62DRAFT_683137 [Auriculariales sp. MPI-PUGE-AT-0066]
MAATATQALVLPGSPMAISPGPSRASTSTLPQPTPPRAIAQHRLIYRGALALPDSNMRLDGIAFTAKIPPQSPHTLLESPIPLALELLRGRPLCLIGVIPLRDVKLDMTNEIHAYINPKVPLTIDFVERNLCFEPIGEMNRTDLGLRIGLGDVFAPNEEDIIVYGRLHQSDDEDLDKTPTLQLVATRIAPASPPKPIVPRVPRPDDPSPRRPDVVARLLFENNAKRGHKHVRSRDLEVDERTNKRAKLNPQMARTKEPGSRATSFQRSASSGGKISSSDLDTDGFRIPVLPTKCRSSDDVRRKSSADEEKSTDSGKMAEADASPLEAANKRAIKAAAMAHLKALGFKKDHPEFKEPYQLCIRGVGFALRKQIALRNINDDLITDLVGKHLEMYVDAVSERTQRVQKSDAMDTL